MNPDQPPQIPPLSTDYLDQIAPQPKRRFSLDKKQWIILGGIGAVVVVLILAIIIGSMSSSTKPTETLAARLESTATVVDDAAGKIKSSSLRALNSNLKIFLTNTIRDIKTPLQKDGVDINKLDKDVVKKESSDKMLATLEDARLNARYDRIYAVEMAYRLDTIVTLMQQIYKNTNNQALKTFLDSAYNNLEPTQKQFANFDETNY